MGPRQKPKKGDNLSHFFTEPISSHWEGNSLQSISGRGTAREKKLILLAFTAFGLMLIGQVKGSFV